MRRTRQQRSRNRETCNCTLEPHHTTTLPSVCTHRHTITAATAPSSSTIQCRCRCHCHRCYGKFFCSLPVIGRRLLGMGGDSAGGGGRTRRSHSPRQRRGRARLQCQAFCRVETQRRLQRRAFCWALTRSSICSGCSTNVPGVRWLRRARGCSAGRFAALRRSGTAAAAAPMSPA